jgi:iron(III) transport system ATP-binding protein
MTVASVKIQNLEKVYQGMKGKQVVAVQGVNLTINPGEFVTLLGPSGCGKTTILRMIAGFEIPTGGDIYIGEQRVNSLTPDKRDTAMVFQSYALFPHLNLHDNVAYGLKIKKLPKDVIEEKVTNILAMVGLEGMGNRAPNQLSGGQQQRVALARALVMEPSVLLFDEPLSNLDAKLRIYMRNEIHKIQRKVGITSIYVTHDQSEAMSLSDRIIIMKAGHIEQIGTPHEVYAQPATPFVADFIGMANITPGKITAADANGVTVEYLGITSQKKNITNLHAGDECKVVTRPEGLKLGRTGMVPCKVVSSVFMGESQDYVVDAGGNKIQVKEYNPMNKEVFAAGADAFLTIDVDSMHLI